MGDKNQFYQDGNGLQCIKTALRQQYGAAAHKERQVDFVDLAQRVQCEDETVEDFSNKLLNMAKSVFNAGDLGRKQSTKRKETSAS